MFDIHRRNSKLSMVAAAFIAAATASLVRAQGTAFTYQGVVKDANGQPLDGSTSMVFRLFDGAGTGQVGVDDLQTVTVAQGLFTATVNASGQFGPTAFNGQPRWVEVTVNGDVQPREQITPTPYAIFCGAPWTTTGSDITYSGGNVGIGRPNPTFKLDMNSPTGFGARLGMEAAGGGALVIAANPGDNRVYLEGYNSTDTGSCTEMLITGYQGGVLPQLTLNANRVGISVAGGNPTASLEVGNTSGTTFYAHGGISTWGVYADAFFPSGIGVFGRGSALATGVRGEAADGRGVEGVSTHASGIGGYFINTNPNGVALWVDGLARIKVLEITGADLSEKFPTSDAKPAPGTVMEIDPDHAGKLRVAQGAYNPRVAGVVSGAGDIPVGAILGNMDGQEDAPAIALSGRVWVRCDTSENAIRPGDMLTTSSVAGHAMKAADLDRARGAIIGKAMTSLAHSNKGLVLVLVTLQ